MGNLLIALCNDALSLSKDQKEGLGALNLGLRTNHETGKTEVHEERLQELYMQSLHGYAGARQALIEAEEADSPMMQFVGIIDELVFGIFVWQATNPRYM